jgi:hypothetical protein
MAFDRIFQGQPSTIAAGNTPLYAALGVDTVDSTLYISAGNGWVPATGTAGAASLTAQTANNANVLTFTAQAAGMYLVSLYEVSTNTPTGATLPAITVVYTDAASNTSVTDTLADVTSVSAAGVVNQGTFRVSVAAGGTIVVATTSYAAGSGTALAYAVSARVSYLG